MADASGEAAGSPTALGESTQAPLTGAGLPNQAARIVRWGRTLAVLLPLLLYAGGLTNDFLIDDAVIISSNIRLAAGQDPREIFRRPEQFADFTLPYYRPLTNLSYWLDAHLWGRRAFGFHLTNWLLHAGVTLSAFALIRRLTGDPTLALLAAAVFAFHPVHTESVDLVQGRTDLLATLCLLLSLLALRWCVLARSVGRAWLAGAATLLALSGALLAKEMAVTWPVLALGLGWADPQVGTRRGRLRIVLATGLGALGGYFLIRRAILGGFLGADLGSLTTPRVGLVPLTLATDLRLLVWPFSFTFIRSIPAPQAWTEPRILGALLLTGALLAGLILLARRDRLAAYGAGWTLITLLPVLNLFAIPGFVLAERYLYLPSVGFCLWVAILIRRGLTARQTRWACASVWIALVALLILFAATIQLRTVEWRDPIGIFEAMAAQAPDSFFVQSNLGLEYLKHDRPQDAIAPLTRARDLQPANPLAWNNLGVALARRGRMAEAREAYQQAIALNPEYARAYQNLAETLNALGDRAGAEAATRAARDMGRRPRP